MSRQAAPPQSALPSVDRVLRRDDMAPFIEQYGRPAATEAVRETLAGIRKGMADGSGSGDEAAIVARTGQLLAERARPTLRRVFNLTGTVLHTNLGRAPLPPEAVTAMVDVATGASNLEYDLSSGRRGDRDSHIEELLCRLTGAEAATVVNNNAAAVLLLLNTLALRREVPVSRGELIEIGGAFRVPDVMTRAGAKLVEIGTTNRTHLKDYAGAIGPRTALLMKIHTSNYEIQGFTAAVGEAELAALAHEHGLPMAVDLGSGTLVDFSRFGLPHEPTPGESLARGVDLVTFSGDKLLGGPQAGIIVGTADLVARIKRNPMKRAMRVDKMTIAALAAVLRLYLDPDRLVQRLPTLRLLARPAPEIMALALRLCPPVAQRMAEKFNVTVENCQSQLGSGSLPVERLPSAALVVRPASERGAGAALKRLAAAFRSLPVPVIGRIHDNAFWMDLRCLEDEAAFLDQLDGLAPGGASAP